MLSSQAYKALVAMQEKYPKGMPDVFTMSPEQKAWIVVKIQVIAQGLKTKKKLVDLKKIRQRLFSATEEIPDGELQKMVSFIFENIEEFKRITLLEEKE